ncbi:MAG: SsrA-binding protein SmpB [Candidatus Moranbacteria bacterium]|nr:SsrA-binding protein SmpB [Candidatus Moranbacteria bacterium]
MKAVINRKARFEYKLGSEYEAGIVLIGSEVKSVKNGRADISNAYVSIRNDEVFLINANIPKYKYAFGLKDYDPLKDRKLLLKKREIFHLKGKIKEKGLTLVPLKLYTKRNRIKVLIAEARGKTEFDKRESIKKRESERRMRSYFKQKLQGRQL